MKFLVVKHALVEGVGIFGRFCHEWGIQLDTTELAQGDRLPDPSSYDGVLVMGGAMMASDEADYPWLVDEKAFIRHAVLDLHKPFLGTCLGAQLLADALGGTVGWLPDPEVGVLPVQLTPVGASHSLFSGLTQPFNALQWHSQAVQELPPHATLLASSAQCPQAFVVNQTAFGLQFHSEIDAQTLDNWLSIPSYCAELDAELGTLASERFRAEVLKHLPQLNQQARLIFEQFVAIARTSPLRTDAIDRQCDIAS